MSSKQRAIICFLWGLAFLLAAVLPSHGQVSVIANLLDGTGATYRTGYLHFQLQNCGANVPNTGMSGNFIVQDSFDLRPGSLNGPISGNVLGNDQILCGNIASTYYLLTPMKDATRPLGPGVPFVICSSSSSLHTCGNGNSLGTFNLNSADPMTSPPPQPGFSLIFGNPLNNQTIFQPTGTTFFWYGTVDFTHATVIGLSGGGGGSGPAISINGTPTGNQAVLNFITSSTIVPSNPSGGSISLALQPNILINNLGDQLLADSGSTNALAGCPTSAISAGFPAGIQIHIVAANTVTGPATFNLCATGAVSIVKAGGLPLVLGDIAQNQDAFLQFTSIGTWQLFNAGVSGVASFTGGAGGARTGAVSVLGTDYGALTTPWQQIGSITSTFAKTSTGTLIVGNPTSDNFLELFPAASGVGVVLEDLNGNGVVIGQGGPNKVTITAHTLSNITVGTDILFNTAALSPVLDISGTLATFSIPVNFTGTGAFQINGSFGTPGQCLLSTGSAVGFGACASGTVVSVSGTANQILSTGGSTPILSLASPLVPPGNVQITQLSNGTTALALTARASSGQTGNLLQFQSAGLSVLAFVDVFGNATFPSITTNGAGAGYFSTAAGTDNGAACVAALTALSVTGKCVEGPVSIATSWVETTPNAAPSVFSVLAVTASSGSPLAAAQHYVATTDSSSPTFIQTAIASAQSAPSGDVATFDGGGNIQDSTILISSLATPTCATATITQPVICGGVDTLAIATAGTTTNNIISVTVPAGHYQINSVINATSTNCLGTSPAGSATSKIVYSDSNGPTTKQLAQLVFATSIPGNGSNAAAVTDLWIVAPTGTMNVQTTWAVCSTSGGDTVDSHFTLMRIR